MKAATGVFDGVMRFVKVASAEPGKPRRSVQELFEAFAVSPH
jgi:hypothetical protein